MNNVNCGVTMYRPDPPAMSTILLEDFSFKMGVFGLVFLVILVAVSMAFPQFISHYSSVTRLLLLVFVVSIQCFTIIVIDRAIRRAKLIISLFKTGQPAVAVLSDIKITGRNEGVPSAVTITYLFLDKLKRRCKGHSASIPFQNILQFLYDDSAIFFDFSAPISKMDIIEGAEILILYDPKDPRKSIWADGFA